jgi:hypothetical protein
VYAARVIDPGQLPVVLEEAVKVVQEGGGAIIEVVLDEEKPGRMGF